MSRDEFMKELEYLLSDIPDEEKSDAIGYYRDYLEEAGPEDESRVIEEFGSPERIASIIRSDLSGNLEDGGAFTEAGYQDERFKDPNYQVANRYELPEATEVHEQNSRSGERSQSQPWTNKTAKIILWIILIIVASPVIFGVGGGIMGMVAGAFGILVAALVVVGVLTFCLLLVGVVLLVAGIGVMVIHPIDGVLLLGLSILLLGLGFLGMALCGVFYGKFIPFLIRSVANLFNGLVHRRRTER